MEHPSFATTPAEDASDLETYIAWIEAGRPSRKVRWSSNRPLVNLVKFVGRAVVIGLLVGGALAALAITTITLLTH